MDNASIRIVDGPLDALVRGLISFTNQDDLLTRISHLYMRLDLDESGALDLEELNAGLKKFQTASAKFVRLSQDVRCHVRCHVG